MRSYETARGLFGFLELVAWAMVGVGVLLAIGAGATAAQYTRGGAMIAILPGATVSFFGLFLVAMVQNARASVDSAEYGQQMLQIARDQLEISRQRLKIQKGRPAASFAEAVQTATKEVGIQWDSGDSDVSFSELNSDEVDGEFQAAAAIGQDSTDYPAIERENFSYRGRSITALSDAYVFDGTDFDTKEEAMAHIDGLVEIINYRGGTIRVFDNTYSVAEMQFETLEAAKNIIDSRIKANQRAPGTFKI